MEEVPSRRTPSKREVVLEIHSMSQQSEGLGLRPQAAASPIDSAARSRPLVEIRDLGMTYPGGVAAIKDFSLDVALGEFIVVLGPSGCGKSTVLQVIAGLLK